MKILILLLIGLNANAMTSAQAKAKITEITRKEAKTNQDILDLKEAIQVISGAWAKRQN